MNNEEMIHGLFGKLSPGEMEEFKSWQEVARYVKELSEKKVNIYRSIISFNRDTSNELGLNTQKDWQNYIENHIYKIAQENNIKIQNLGFACAAHDERHHPHIHIDFWDKEQEILNNFTKKEIPNKIRKQLIKDTFEDRIKSFYGDKEASLTEIKEITDEMLVEFDDYIKNIYPKEYQQYKKDFETFEEDTITSKLGNPKLNSEQINKIAQKLFELKDKMPKKGRLAYKLLSKELKEEVDKMVTDVINSSGALRQGSKLYVESKMNIAKLYSSNKEYLEHQKNKFQKEVDKIIANKILNSIKVLLKKEKEIDKVEYKEEQKKYYAEQLLVGVIDLLERMSVSNERRGEDLTNKVVSTELSKQARVEYYLKNKDKGIEM